MAEIDNQAQNQLKLVQEYIVPGIMNACKQAEEAGFTKEEVFNSLVTGYTETITHILGKEGTARMLYDHARHVAMVYGVKLETEH